MIVVKQPYLEPLTLGTLTTFRKFSQNSRIREETGPPPALPEEGKQASGFRVGVQDSRTVCCDEVTFRVVQGLGRACERPDAVLMGPCSFCGLSRLLLENRWVLWCSHGLCVW